MSLDPKVQNESAQTATTPAESGNNGWSVDGNGAAPAPQVQRGVHLWLHRTSVFLFVLVSAIAGVLLVILPWTPEWTDNYLLLTYPWLRTLISTGFFRGLCSGLGVLDIWIGFWEALHYHDRQ